MTWLVAVVACTGPPSKGEPSAHSAAEVDHTGVPSVHSEAPHTGSPGHSGTADPWVVPTPPACELSWVPSTDPGPVFRVTENWLQRIEGGDGELCGSPATALPDGDGDGRPDLAFACLNVDTYAVDELRWYDGTRLGRLHAVDAAGTISQTSSQEGISSIGAGSWTGSNLGDLFVGVDAGTQESYSVELPLPRGRSVSSDVRHVTIEPYRSTGYGPRIGIADVDGDGEDDLAITSHNPRAILVPPGHAGGGISVFRGPEQNDRVALDEAWSTYDAGSFDRPSGAGIPQSGWYGFPTTGDLDGDGDSEVLIGGDYLLDYAPALYEANGGAVLFLGGTAGWHSDPEARAVLYGTCSSTLWGEQGPVGDVTGDGHPDVALGGAYLSLDAADHYRIGGAFVFSDLTATEGYRSVATADAIVLGEGRGSALQSIGRVGDVDGDGVDDWMVGATGAAGAVGRAYLFRGPVQGVKNAADADLVLEGGVNDRTFGTGFGIAGDVDADGIDDLWVSAPNAAWNGGTNEGAVYVLSGAELRSRVRR